MSVEKISELSMIDKWFIDQIDQIIKQSESLKNLSSPESLLIAKQMGFSDKQIAHLCGLTELEVRKKRKQMGINVTFKPVDTCAAEFEAYTPYYYSTYETEDEVRSSDKPKVVILGSGPNRIGQGIEFDYCCVHASFALREAGYESIMINSNPETVSTDYDTSDRLYFEPLTFEDVMNVIERENPEGVIVQLGGQTPLKLARQLENAGVKILGTSPESIDLAEDRKRFGAILEKLKIPFAPYGTATSLAEAESTAKRIGYPVLVRPSYVLGGRAMEIVYTDEMLEKYMKHAVKASPEHPVLVDKFLEGAIEIDVDALYDGETFLLGGIMEHIEEAGIHSGDSACVLPPRTIPTEIIELAETYTKKLAKELGVKGLINIQMAYKDGALYVLEVNPRASRTVPFVSKATGRTLAKIGTMIMLGKKLKDLDVPPAKTGHISVKEAVLPFNKFPGEDIVLGPEMKSTGEVMGIDYSFGTAFAKAQISAGSSLPSKGKVFISVCDRDKAAANKVANDLKKLGFNLLATGGTAKSIGSSGVDVDVVKKANEGKPNVIDLINEGEIDLIINTPFGRGPRTDGYQIRTSATSRGVPCITTISGAEAAIQGITAIQKGELKVKSIQEYLNG
jgi:carbamoyl-phosphate synthase large subunit